MEASSKAVRPRKGLYDELYSHNTKAFEAYKSQIQPQYSSARHEKKQRKVSTAKESNKPVLAEYKSLIDVFKETVPRSNNPITDVLSSKSSSKGKGVPSSAKSSHGSARSGGDHMAQSRLK